MGKNNNEGFKERRVRKIDEQNSRLIEDKYIDRLVC